MNNIACRAAPLLALAMVPLSAHAAEAESDSTIIVTAPLLIDAAEERVARTPGGADVVGYEDYADKSIVGLRDTLAFSPGVYLQPRYGQEVRISIRGSGLSRGFHMRGLTLLQDGVPMRLQNRTSFDWGAFRLDVGGFFRADYAAGPVELTLGGELRRGATDAHQYVNVAGRRGALTFDADQTARTANLYGEVRVRPVEPLTLIAGGVYADGFR